MNKLHMIIHLFDDGATTLQNVKKESLRALRCVFPSTDHEGKLNFALCKWVKTKADPFKDLSRL